MTEKNKGVAAHGFITVRRFGGVHPPGEKPKALGSTLKRLWRFIGKEKKLLTAILLFVAADSIILLLVPYLIGRVVDFISLGEGAVDFNLVWPPVLILTAVITANLFLTALNNILIAGVSQKIVKNIRMTLFKKLRNIPISYFDLNTHGELMSRFTNDIDNISTTISNSTITLMSDIIAISGSFVMMLALNPVLTAAGIITLPLVLLLSRTITDKTRVLFRKQQNALGVLNGHIEESISGLQVVKAFNREEKVLKDFEKMNTDLCEVGIKAQIISGYMMPLMNVIGNVGFSFTAAVGGVMALNGLITVGTIASFLSYSRQFTRPLNEVANIFNALQTAVAGAERIFEVLDAKEEAKDPPGAEELINPSGEVIFENVTFAYRPDVPVLKNVSFRAEAGSTVALVGPTGAGKTTIVNLINRFYDVTGGRILLDGKDVRNYTKASLRKSFGIVLQDTYLFSGTIKDNIRYGKLDATDEEIINAATKAGADEFIRKLKDGYDTFLSEGADSLSQGQKQLIAISRAVLSDPPILILDEATSSVDTRTEMKIQEAMVELMRGRTCFIIAHRLSTIRGADIIMVIENGRIVEKGSHEELIGKKGHYYNLYESQFKNIQ